MNLCCIPSCSFLLLFNALSHLIITTSREGDVTLKCEELACEPGLYLPSKSCFVHCVANCVWGCHIDFSPVLNCVQLFVTAWTVASQPPLCMELSRPEYWSGLPFPFPGNPPDPGIEPTSLASPALAGRFFIR